MVLRVKRWEDVVECLRFARYPLYRIIEKEDLVEVRVKAGKIGWIGEFSSNDERLRNVLRTLKDYGAVEVVGSISDDLFFS